MARARNSLPAPGCSMRRAHRRHTPPDSIPTSALVTAAVARNSSRTIQRRARCRARERHHGEVRGARDRLRREADRGVDMRPLTAAYAGVPLIHRLSTWGGRPPERRCFARGIRAGPTRFTGRRGGRWWRRSTSDDCRRSSRYAGGREAPVILDADDGLGQRKPRGGIESARRV
jgi:hypothetical protein